jgi:hypothetical protein
VINALINRNLIGKESIEGRCDSDEGKGANRAQKVVGVWKRATSFCEDCAPKASAASTLFTLQIELYMKSGACDQMLG